jgi:hypothetical protein
MLSKRPVNVEMDRIPHRSRTNIEISNITLPVMPLRSDLLSSIKDVHYVLTVGWSEILGRSKYSIPLETIITP